MLCKKISNFCQKIEDELQNQKHLDHLQKEGKTWKVVELNGLLLDRGEKTQTLSVELEDQRLFY
jgi:hypothetical protein